METEKKRAIDPIFFLIVLFMVLLMVCTPALGHAQPTDRTERRRSSECESGDDVAKVSKVQYDRKKEDAVLTYSANSRPSCTATSLSGETTYTGRGLLQLKCVECVFITDTTITLHMDKILDKYNITEEGVDVLLKWTHLTCGTIQYNAVLAINSSTTDFLFLDPEGKPIEVELLPGQNRTSTEGPTNNACSRTGTHMWLLSVAIAMFAWTVL